MEQSKDDVTRRASFIKIGLGSVAVAGCGAAVFGYQFLSPNVLYEPSPIVEMWNRAHRLCLLHVSLSELGAQCRWRIRPSLQRWSRR